jgi:hypothetical protein
MLPYEIWALILRVVTQPLVDQIYPHLACDSETFPLVQFQMLWCEGHNYQDWFNIRLVCRTWNAIVGPCPYISSFRDSDLGPQRQILKNIRKVSIKHTFDTFESFRSLCIHPEVRNSLTTLFIRGNGSDWQGHIEYLLRNNEVQFPSLRCLTLSLRYFSSYQNLEAKLPDFWERLHAKFPDLLALSLLTRMPTPRGTVSMRRLRILEFHPRNRTDVWYDFPSLRHCSVRNSRWVIRNFPCSHMIESLICYNRVLQWTEGFWEMFPRLKMLGLKASAVSEFNLQSLPPPAHPLYHLQVILHYMQPEVKSELIKHMLSFFVNVTLLSVDDDVRLEDLEFTDRPNLRIVTVPPPVL